ncbi:hypothetical protein ACQP06_13545 [Nocardia sp. CA-136227]|uniref:hypothetical protein n=1 Tax=Nocardia sp. CA-136227 TaxID=3239979 RepID=UPI003D997410
MTADNNADSDSAPGPLPAQPEPRAADPAAAAHHRESVPDRTDGDFLRLEPSAPEPPPAEIPPAAATQASSHASASTRRVPKPGASRHRREEAPGEDLDPVTEPAVRGGSVAGEGVRRPVMPEIVPVGAAPEAATQPVEVAGWASWLTEGAAAEPVSAGRDSEWDDEWRAVEDLRAEDPMAALVDEARRRSVQTQRRLRIRARAIAIAGVSLALVVVAGVAWLMSSAGDSNEPQAVPGNSTASAPGGTAGTSTASGNQPGQAVWCRETDTPQRVSGAGAGNLNSGPGVIMRLEYAWYVLRDAAAVRSVLSADARVAPEQATRDAISATPAGTQHCVTITEADADRWNVNVDEKHPDGTQTSWQQVITTATRDGRTTITSIIAGSR